VILEPDFKAAIREYLEAGPPDEVTELVQQLEMELASPGDWHAARFMPSPEPDTMKETPGDD
jgi:hypothetical protein